MIKLSDLVKAGMSPRCCESIIDVNEHDHCPACGTSVSAVTSFDPNETRSYVREGDIVICPRCGCLLEFNKDLRQVLASQATLNLLDDKMRSDIAQAQEVVRKANK